MKLGRTVPSCPNYNLQILKYAVVFHGLSLSTGGGRILTQVSMVLENYIIIPWALCGNWKPKLGLAHSGTDWEGEKRGGESVQSKGPLGCLQTPYFFPLPEFVTRHLLPSSHPAQRAKERQVGGEPLKWEHISALCSLRCRHVYLLQEPHCCRNSAQGSQEQPPTNTREMCQNELCLNSSFRSVSII